MNAKYFFLLLTIVSQLNSAHAEKSYSTTIHSVLKGVCYDAHAFYMHSGKHGASARIGNKLVVTAVCTDNYGANPKEHKLIESKSDLHKLCNINGKLAGRHDCQKHYGTYFYDPKKRIDKTDVLKKSIGGNSCRYVSATASIDDPDKFYVSAYCADNYKGNFTTFINVTEKQLNKLCNINGRLKEFTSHSECHS